MCSASEIYNYYRWYSGKLPEQTDASQYDAVNYNKYCKTVTEKS